MSSTIFSQCARKGKGAQLKHSVSKHDQLALTKTPNSGQQNNVQAHTNKHSL